MKINFENIEEFINLKDRCIFCYLPLKPILTNFIGHENGIPVITSKLNDKNFVFRIKYDSPSKNINVIGNIDIKSNDVTFCVVPDHPFSAFTMLHQIIETFEDLSPHVELRCVNKKCKNNYYISSSVFKVIEDRKIRSFLLYMECFNVDRLWVQNDWISRNTYIYSENNVDAEPLKVPFINFQSMDACKLLTRIKTIVTFS
jgi:hypothetical protein